MRNGNRRIRRTEAGEVSEGVANTLTVLGVIAAIVVVILLIFGAIIGIYAFSKNIGRSQARADARNHVKISGIEIANQEQQIKVHRQRAEIRRVDAIGVREAQDEIAKTLTPLYVQFEMVDALKQIATSGSNNSVVYIPSGANGIPLISNANPLNQVGQPDSGK